MRKLLYIIITTILLAACVGGGKERAALDAAQTIINDRPDSALAILDSLEPSSQEFSRSTLRRWQLLRLMAQNKCDTVFRSDSLQLIITEYFDRHGTPNEKMWAHYLLGRAYYDIGEAIPALKAYEDAASAADTASADCDFWNLSRVYYQEAELLYYQNLPDEIFEALGNSSLTAKKAGDTITDIICYEKRAMAYERLGKTDSMAVAGMVASAMYHDIGQYQMAARALYWVIPYNIENGDYPLARKHLDIYEGQSGFFDDGRNIQSGLEHFYSEKGKYYLGVGMRDSAEACFRKCLVMRHLPEDRITKDDYYRVHAGLQGLAKLYRQENRLDSAYKYALLSEAFNDSTYKYTYMDEALQMKKLYSYIRHVEKEKRLQAKNSKMRRTVGWGASIASFLLFLGGVLLYYRLRGNRPKAAQDKCQESKTDMLRKLKEIRQDQAQKWDLIADEMGEKCPKAVIQYLDGCSEQIDKLIFLIQEETEGRQGDKPGGCGQYCGEAGDDKHPFVHMISSGQYQPLSSISKDEWREVEDFFNECHPNLMKRLKSTKDLSMQDFRICLLTKLGISSSMTAIMLGCSRSSLSMTKKRIIKKLSGRDETGRNLYRYL